jgi:collagenase-like PrtC family protease
MSFSLSTNFDHALISQVHGCDIKKLYGKLSRDAIGGGRSSVLLPEVSREHIEEHVRLAHEHSIEFDYLMNATCINNIEHTKSGLKTIYDELDWLRTIKVDWITVSVPFLIDIIHNAAPEIKVGLSVSAHVDSAQKAKQFERMGVHEITLPEALNRNFRLLEKIRKSVGCGIRLIATNSCIMACPYKRYHGNYLSHTSQTGEGVNVTPLVDLCYLRCTRQLLERPEELVKACWIRPDDLHYYEDIGITDFKLTERNKTTSALVKTAMAYHNRCYNGYFSDLLSLADRSQFLPPNYSILLESGVFSDPEFMNATKLYAYRRFKIKNSGWDGFLEFFQKNAPDCLNIDCGTECRHCYKYAERCVEVDIDENARRSDEIDCYFKSFFKKPCTLVP